MTVLSGTLGSNGTLFVSHSSLIGLLVKLSSLLLLGVLVQFSVF
jgi:hypothetical protein